MEAATASEKVDSRDEYELRVSLEVSSLSTKLIEAIDKQSALETSNQILKRQNLSLFQQLQELKDTQVLYEKAVADNVLLKAELEQNIKLKSNAELEVSRLRVEIEELSESLFNEANKMVKEARVETENYRLRNNKLSDTLEEKNTTIESLTSELKILKKLLYELENENAVERRESVVSTPDPSADSLISDSNNDDSLSVSQRDQTTLLSQNTMFSSSKLSSYDKQLIYTPIYNSLRFDLANFDDFVKFVKFLYNRNSLSTIVTPVDFSVLKETAFFKKIFKEEIEPALAIDTAPDIGYFNRKNFMGALVEGRVIIEPISGVNESFKLNHRKSETEEQTKEKLFSYPKNSPPVATLAPCSICGEARNDILEHSRLYTLKLYSKKATNISQHKYDPPSSPSNVATLLPNETPSSSRATLEITHQYSLCNYCLIKVRHICELFAFIRNINNSPKTKVWNFEQSSQPKYDLDLECIKAWFQMTKIRAKIFWSRVGIWDINEYSTAAVSSPALKSEPSLGYRGSFIGTGIIAGSRQSFMESVTKGNDKGIASQGRRPDIINSLRSSPAIGSPLLNQTKGYFEDEEAAATSDDFINVHLNSDSLSVIAGSSTLNNETSVATEVQLEDPSYETDNILDDYGSDNEEVYETDNVSGTPDFNNNMGEKEELEVPVAEDVDAEGNILESNDQKEEAETMDDVDTPAVDTPEVDLIQSEETSEPAKEVDITGPKDEEDAGEEDAAVGSTEKIVDEEETEEKTEPTEETSTEAVENPTSTETKTVPDNSDGSDEDSGEFNDASENLGQ